MYIGSIILLIKKGGIEFTDLITIKINAPEDYLANIEVLNIIAKRAIEYSERGFTFVCVYSINLCEYESMRTLIAIDLDDAYSLAKEYQNGI